jgi:hypothetical protein
MTAVIVVAGVLGATGCGLIAAWVIGEMRRRQR